MANLFVEIIKPDQELFKGEVKLIQLPGMDGSFEVLKNHAPLISILKEGKVRILDLNHHESFYEIKGGVLEVLGNKVLILAE
jgi:F-type H+-transporting ATPase subunit epsilon